MDKPDERGYVEAPTQADERADPSQPAPVVEYATPPNVNGEARRSLIYGALLPVPFVTGYLAMRHGRRGARIAEETGIGRRTSLIGFMLGVANFILWTVIVIALPPTITNARRQAQTVQCLSQMRQMSVGIFMYANANGGWTPPALNLATTGIPSFTCPAAPAGASNYVYVVKPIRINSVPRPSAYVTIYEPPTNHVNLINFAYLDGHCESIPLARAQKIINELNAGFNPPRAERIQ
jgi:prepilin-type processing-associated H-X9-DG protein